MLWLETDLTRWRRPPKRLDRSTNTSNHGTVQFLGTAMFSFSPARHCIAHTDTKNLRPPNPAGLGCGCRGNSSGSLFDVGAASGADKEYQSGIWGGRLMCIWVMLRRQLKRISAPLLLVSHLPTSLFLSRSASVVGELFLNLLLAVPAKSHRDKLKQLVENERRILKRLTVNPDILGVCAVKRSNKS